MSLLAALKQLWGSKMSVGFTIRPDASGAWPADLSVGRSFQQGLIGDDRAGMGQPWADDGGLHFFERPGS